MCGCSVPQPADEEPGVRMGTRRHPRQRRRAVVHRNTGGRRGPGGPRSSRPSCSRARRSAASGSLRRSQVRRRRPSMPPSTLPCSIILQAALLEALPLPMATSRSGPTVRLRISSVSHSRCANTICSLVSHGIHQVLPRLMRSRARPGVAASAQHCWAPSRIVGSVVLQITPRE